MTKPATSTVFMVRPVQFRYNEQTATDNAFQVKNSDTDTQLRALEEFDQLVQTLRNHQVDVTIIDDTEEFDTPDSIFPNNWVSTHEGRLVIYPMFAENRRPEVRHDIIDRLSENHDYETIIDFTSFTEVDQFLEGTGSLVIDRKNNIVYAGLSERTDANLAEKWAEVMGYELVLFEAQDKSGQPIYHTNVMMGIAENYAVICLDCITNEKERMTVKNQLIRSGKTIIDLSQDQVEQFAGNMIELQNKEGQSLLIMSSTAHQSLTEQQIQQIEQFSTIVVSAIPTIEKNGGGSVRCMIAELY